MDFLRANIGEEGFNILIVLVILIPCLAFLIFTLKNIGNALKASLFLIFFALGLLGIYLVEIPEEKIHILEFAILGWLSARDLTSGNKKAGWALAIAFVFVVGALDELFQGILPYRYFQYSDIMLNSLGAAWGVTLYRICY